MENLHHDLMKIKAHVLVLY